MMKTSKTESILFTITIPLILIIGWCIHNALGNRLPLEVIEITQQQRSQHHFDSDGGGGVLNSIRNLNMTSSSVFRHKLSAASYNHRHQQHHHPHFHHSHHTERERRRSRQTLDEVIGHQGLIQPIRILYQIGSLLYLLLSIEWCASSLKLEWMAPRSYPHPGCKPSYYIISNNNH